MIKREHIPDEAAHKAAGEWLMGASWPNIIAAAINAWPDAEKEHSGVCCNSKGSIILPMPQEKNDE